MTGARSERVAQQPALPLRGFIDGYVGYRQTRLLVGLHRGLPSRHLTFIVSIDNPIRLVAQTDPTQAPATYGTVVSGLRATSALIASGGDQEGVAVELTPLGCRALLGFPASEMWNLSLEAEDVLGRAAVELRERLHLAGGWPARFAACDSVFGDLLGATRPTGAEVAEAWRLVVASGGSLPVADIAVEVGWSRRQLTRRFTGEFGLSPKLASRVERFGRACRMLRDATGPPIAEVAAACGYYDQPHLNRDFVEFAGCPPGEWRAEEVPSVQDPEALEPSSSGP